MKPQQRKGRKAHPSYRPLRPVEGPISFSRFVFGDVAYARVQWGEGWGEWKVRPVVFLGAANRYTARVLPIYSKPKNGSPIETVLSGRRCFISRLAVLVDRSDVVALTDQNRADAIGRQAA